MRQGRRGRKESQGLGTGRWQTCSCWLPRAASASNDLAGSMRDGSTDGSVASDVDDMDPDDSASPSAGPTTHTY